jgi:hypothetical protein
MERRNKFKSSLIVLLAMSAINAVPAMAQAPDPENPAPQNPSGIIINNDFKPVNEISIVLNVDGSTWTKGGGDKGNDGKKSTDDNGGDDGKGHKVDDKDDNGDGWWRNHSREWWWHFFHDKIGGNLQDPN